MNDPTFIDAMSKFPLEIRSSGLVPILTSAADFALVIKREEEILKKEGLDNASTQQALQEMERLKADIAANTKDIGSPKRIVVQIAFVAKTACDLASRLRGGDTSISKAVPEKAESDSH